MRTIKTARSIARMNKAAAEGFRPLVLPVEPDYGLTIEFTVLQNRKTGVVSLDNGPPHNGKVIEFSADEAHVYSGSYYPYHRRLPFAAYLLPADLALGEQVMLDDVIEDKISGTYNGHPYRLNQCKALWDGEQFILDKNSLIQFISVG